MRVLLFLILLLGTSGDNCAQQCPQGFFQEIFTDVPVMGTTYFGGGISTYDIDEDGWDDLTIGISGYGYFVFKNQNGNLELWWNFPSNDDVKQCLWGDLNNDGFNDFIGLTTQGEILLYQNVGNEYFINVGQSLNAQIPDRIFMGASLGDVNRDGRLDLYLCAYDDGVNVFLRNISFLNGDISFYWDSNSIFTGTSKSSFQPVWIDLNNDDFSDLFVVNDFNQGNDYYQSNINGGFQKMDEILQLDFPVQSMSNSWSDFDLDGDLDVMITDTARTFLLENNGGVFSPILDDAYVPFWTWSALWIDTENDFYDDILVTGNNVISSEGAFFYFRNTGGQFEECEMSSFVSARYFAAAKWDVNNDFYYDAVLAPDSGFYPLKIGNVMWDASAIKVRFEGSWSNRNAVGLKYKSYSGGMCKSGQIFSGENYLSQNSQNLILPVAQNYGKVDSLFVQWPSGIIETWYNLNNGETFLIQEGSSGWYSDSVEIVVCPGDSIYFSQPNLFLSFNPDWGFSDSLVFSETGDYLVQTRSRYGLNRTMYVHVTESNFSFDFELLDDNCFDSIALMLFCIDENQFEVDSFYFSGSPSDVGQAILVSPDGCSSQISIDALDLFQAPLLMGNIDTLCWNEAIDLYDVFVTSDSGFWQVNNLEMDSLYPGVNSIVFESFTGCHWDTIVNILTYPMVDPVLSTFADDTCNWFYLSNDGFTSVIWNNQWATDTLCLSNYSGELTYSALDNSGCLSEGHSFVQTASIGVENIMNDCLSREIWDLQGRCLAIYEDCNDPLTSISSKGFCQLVLVREKFIRGERTYLMLLGF